MKKSARQTYTIDATGKTIGRMATDIAIKLRGKDKPEYQLHIDSGAEVIVENIKAAKFTGTKLDGKLYYSHSGYPGGLKETKLKDLFAKKPDEVLKKAVWNMLPKNRLRAPIFQRLTVKI